MKELSREVMLAELAGLKEKAKKASDALDFARVSFERHVGAVEAMQCLMAEYFPAAQSPSQEPSSPKKNLPVEEASKHVSAPPK